MHHICGCRAVCLTLQRWRYQKHIAIDTIVDSGGANPIQNSEVGSIWLKSHDRGMRNRKVAIRL